MKKQYAYILGGILLVAGLLFGAKLLRDEYLPVPVDPSPEWEPYISTLNVQREYLFVDSDGTKLEAELFIPNGGQEKKPAIVFSVGSGDSLYQNYSPDFIETYVLDTFLAHDFAVLLVNKRGMGLSEGLYTSRSITGRAEDMLASAQAIRTHPKIDAENIGLVGHSEGGWVVTYAAAQDPEIAFFINFAGPTITRMEQAIDMYTYEAICSGLEGDELDQYVKMRTKTTELGMKIGKVTNFGLLGFDYRSMSFDPRNALKTVESPGLFIFGENDVLVIPDKNIERMNEIFDGKIPENFSVTALDRATHSFRLVDAPCDSFQNPEGQQQSEQLTEVLHTWLTEIGY